MGILILLAILLVVASLLSLPFVLWFGWQRRPAERRGLPLAGQVLLIMAGAMAGVFVLGFSSDSVLAILAFGLGPLDRACWLAAMLLGLAFVGHVLQSFGVPVLRPREGAAVRQAPARRAPPAPSPLRRRIATVRGVPVFAHPSVLFEGLLVAALVRPGLAGTIACCLAFAALVAIHEFGHFAAARAVGIRVYSVELSGDVSACRVHVPRSHRHTLLVFGAGLAAQAVVLLLALAATAVAGPPRTGIGLGVHAVCVYANLVVFVVNLIPFTGRDGLASDGAVLWRLLAHVAFGRPHPLAEQHAASPLLAPGTRTLSVPYLVPSGFTTGVEILNDDTTPMEFVVDVLQRHLGLDHEAAIALMVRIHTQGGALLPLPDRAHAERIAAAIAQDARAGGHALVCRPVDAGDPSVGAPA